MYDEAKIHLSTLETELVNNTQWIFTKQIIIEKVYHLLGQLHEHYKKIITEEEKSLPIAFQKPGGKITKGEKYKGLPYLILDYPAMFSRKNIFAVRTMFWWGNFFSISLHLSGENFQHRKDISQWLDFLRQRNFFISVNENEWEHHFHSFNYININDLEEEQAVNVSEKSFFKIAKKIELTQWDAAPQFLEQTFEEIIQFIKISFPGGEKVL